MRYILYARKSGEGDERQIQSIPDQCAVLRRLASDIGLCVSHQFEEAHSAKAPGTRPVFAQMIELIRRSEADAILCWSIHRLFRNPVDEGTVRWLLQGGILKEIRTPERSYLPSDSALLLAVEGGFANQYILDLSRNVKRGLAEKARRGEWPGKAPPGYANVREIVAGIELRRIAKDPVGFEFMRRSWALLLTGCYTAIEIHEQLKSGGYRTPKSQKLGGRCISLATLYECFGNPFYYGWFEYNGELYKGSHPAMVSKEEFDRAQHILGRGSKPGARVNKQAFAFSGHMKCAVCGHQVTAERKIKHYPTTKRTREYVYYHCNGFKGCRRSVAEWEIEAVIKGLLLRFQFDRETTNWIEGVLVRDRASNLAASGRVQQKHEAALQKARQRMQALLEMRLEGELSPEEFVEAKKRQQEEIVRLQNATELVIQRDERRRRTARSLGVFLSTAYDRFTNGSLKHKREVAIALGATYTLSNGRLQAKPHPLLAPFLKIEPHEKHELQVQRSKNVPRIPALCRALEQIRTLIERDDTTFPQLSEPFGP